MENNSYFGKNEEDYIILGMKTRNWSKKWIIFNVFKFILWKIVHIRLDYELIF